MRPLTAALAPAPGKHCKDLRRRAFIDAAVAVFAEKGYGAATTREIAERAGCSEGLIHRYFGGKRGLLMASLQQRAEEQTRDYIEGLAPCECVDEEIRQLLLWSYDQAWKHREAMRVAVSQACIDQDMGATMGRLFVSDRVGLTVARLQRHQSAGRIRDDVDLEVVARMIGGLGFAGGFMQQVVFAADRNELRRVAAEAATLISRSIETPQCGGERGTGPC